MWEELKEEDWERGRVRDADLTGWVTDRHSAGFWSLVLRGICDTDGEQASRSSTVPEEEKHFMIASILLKIDSTAGYVNRQILHSAACATSY